MEKIDVTVSVAKNSYEFGGALKNVVKNIRDALDDGFQPGQDIPVILTQSLKELMIIMKNATQLDDDFKSAEKMLAAKALTLQIQDIVALFLK